MELGELKGAGETYDDLLATLNQEHQRRELGGRASEVREADSGELALLTKI